jgi:hypothetical protein
MAEVLINSQSPIMHKVFWNGDVADADALPTVALYDVTMDPNISPAINPTQLLTTLTSSLDENNPGVYIVNIPYQYTSRNRTLRLDWNYYIGGTNVKKTDEVFVVTPYVDFANACGCLEISTDSSDPNYKSYRDLIRAEKYARKVIEQHTGQNFYLKDEIFVVYGHDSDILPLPSRVAEIYSLYARDILLLDNIEEINNWNYDVIVSESAYGIRINRASMLDNTVYTANGMVPPSINDYGNGVFQSGVPYKIYGRFGWEKVPDDVELAAIELMKDYFAKDTVWRNKYIKKISTFDWDFEYTGEAHTGTGNAYADKLLADYVLTTKVEII